MSLTLPSHPQDVESLVEPTDIDLGPPHRDIGEHPTLHTLGQEKSPSNVVAGDNGPKDDDSSGIEDGSLTLATDHRDSASTVQNFADISDEEVDDNGDVRNNDMKTYVRSWWKDVLEASEPNGRSSVSDGQVSAHTQEPSNNHLGLGREAQERTELGTAFEAFDFV